MDNSMLVIVVLPNKCKKNVDHQQLLQYCLVKKFTMKSKKSQHVCF
jgi:hypothetical protein